MNEVIEVAKSYVADQINNNIDISMEDYRRSGDMAAVVAGDDIIITDRITNIIYHESLSVWNNIVEDSF